MISVEGPSMLILFIVLSAIFLHQDNAHFRETNDQGDFKLLLEILSKPRLLDRRKEELGNFLEPKTEAFSWKMCGSKTDAIQIKTLSVAPDPIKLPGNITLAFSGSINSPDPITSPIEMELTIKKKLFVWITIPCIDHVGSCTYPDICSQSNASSCPPAFKKYGIPCSCPIKPGNYNLPPTVMALPKENMPGWLSEGDYKVEVRLRHQSKEILCLSATGSIDD
ncbi:hypothetical protein NP493_724g01007 [Ridgeia piscesae]|uniref:MD-2-related lipid-recognition domain-containing protein n=1 Tax=Ridgeia piscesae TaxID=27915 RepID=A0AAD9NMM7_RIDPI|nr:hypothetical protein NP493_724g01007 [Ridgeia piscesae]